MDDFIDDGEGEGAGRRRRRRAAGSGGGGFASQAMAEAARIFGDATVGAAGAAIAIHRISHCCCCPLKRVSFVAATGAALSKLGLRLWATVDALPPALPGRRALSPPARMPGHNNIGHHDSHYLTTPS
jgi:hypothetical protein